MFCMFGCHKWVVINRVSLLHYMYLALGQTIIDLDTPTLIELMRQLIYAELPAGAFIYNYTTMEKLANSFSEDDMVFMRKHIDSLLAIETACKEARDKASQLRARINDEIYVHKRHEFSIQRDRVLVAAEPQCNQISIVTTHLLLRFCSKCHKSYDPREQLGIFLPKIKGRLDVAKMNEENGYFLLPKQ